MTEQSRRDFLKQLATGTVYAAPVVSTLVAPRSASGLVQMMGDPSPKDMGMGMDDGGGMGMGQQRNLPRAPWGKRPPGG